MTEIPTSDLFRWSVPELQEWARRLTDQGWAVTPIRAFRDAKGDIKKTPISPGWLHKGLLTDDDIDSFAELRMTHLALVLGAEHVALDFENKKGAHVEETYAVLRKAYGSLPTDRVQRTLTGGLHGLFRIDRARIEKFSGRALLPDGAQTAVDVVREGYLCLVLYQPDFPGVAPDSDQIPWLPEPWYRAISRPARRIDARQRNRSESGGATRGQALFLHVQAIADAEVRSRNITLRDRTRDIVRDGLWTDQAERDVILAALEAGLEKDEVGATVASAVDYGIDEIWGDCLSWLAHVQAMGIDEPSEVWGLACLLCARIVVAYKSIDDPFSISDRELAERLGIDRKGARRYVQRLMDVGLIAKGTLRTSFHPATIYTFLTPNPTEELLPSHSKRKNTRTLDGGARLGLYAAVTRALERVELGRHRAFQQIGDGPWLPRSGIQILDALSRSPEGLGSDTAIARIIGRDRGTVRRTVNELLDADLVVRVGRSVRLKGPNTLASLDEWCDLYAVPDRVALRKERHEEERRRLDLYDQEKRRGKYGPRSKDGRVSLDPADWNAIRAEEEDKAAAVESDGEAP